MLVNPTRMAKKGNRKRAIVGSDREVEWNQGERKSGLVGKKEES